MAFTVLILSYVPLWILSGVPGMPDQCLHDLEVLDLMLLVVIEFGLVGIAGAARSLHPP